MRELDEGRPKRSQSPTRSGPTGDQPISDRPARNRPISESNSSDVSPSRAQHVTTNVVDGKEAGGQTNAVVKRPLLETPLVGYSDVPFQVILREISTLCLRRSVSH